MNEQQNEERKNMPDSSVWTAILGLPLVGVAIERTACLLWGRLRRTKRVHELDKANRQLTDELTECKQKILEYDTRRSIQEDLAIDGGIVYKSKSTGDTFCIYCFDGNGKRVHVVPDQEGYYCGVCKQSTHPTTTHVQPVRTLNMEGFF